MEAALQPSAGEWGLAAGLQPKDFSANQLNTLQDAGRDRDAQSLEELFDDFLNQELMGFKQTDPAMVGRTSAYIGLCEII